MSKTLDQIFIGNPITSNAATDLMYFVQLPYSVGTDAGMTYANFAAQFQAPLPATATADQVLLSGASSSPSWSTATYPATTTINQLLYSSANNVIGGITAGNNGVFITSATGIPSWLANSGTPGFVLTANSGAPPSWQSITTEGAITTIDGDSGSATPSAGVLTISGGTTGLTTSGATNTLSLTGVLKLANGGSNANLTASNGGIIWSNATQMQVLAGTATAGQILISGASATPSWLAAGGGGTLVRSVGTAWAASTTTLANSFGVNTIVYAASANNLSGLATGNNGVLITSATGVPSWLADGTTGQILTATTGSPPTWASPAASGTVNSGTINDLAYYAASGTAVSALATANSSGLLTNGSGVPAWVTVTGTGAPVLATSPTITTPVIAQINDSNGNAMLTTNVIASAVNAIEIQNNTTGNQPILTAGGSGSDTNIGLIIESKGTGVLFFESLATSNQYQFDAGTNNQSVNIFNFPNTAQMSTFTWPAVSGTVLLTTSSIPASALPAGTMFNFHQAQLTTPVTTTSSTFATATGLSVAITPTSASNTVLVRAVVQYSCTPGATAAIFQLARGSTAIGVGTSVGSRLAVGTEGKAPAAADMATIVLEWLDSPATTSATTYNLQFASLVNTQTVAINSTVTDTNSALFARTASTISVCEIHA